VDFRWHSDINRFVPQIVSDGKGGAILLWSVTTSDNYTYNIYAQRVNSDGSILWANNGIQVGAGTPNNYLSNFQSIADGAGGAILVWEDSRNISISSTDIYVQRINSDGSTLWTDSGVPVCTAPGIQTAPHLTSDGAGGTIITWQDMRMNRPISVILLFNESIAMD